MYDIDILLVCKSTSHSVGICSPLGLQIPLYSTSGCVPHQKLIQTSYHNPSVPIPCPFPPSLAIADCGHSRRPLMLSESIDESIVMSHSVSGDPPLKAQWDKDVYPHLHPPPSWVAGRSVFWHLMKSEVYAWSMGRNYVFCENPLNFS